MAIMRRFNLESSAEGLLLRLQGSWCLDDLTVINQALVNAGADIAQIEIVDGSELTDLDTAGAMLFCQCMKAAGHNPEKLRWQNFTQRQEALLDLIKEHPNQPTAIRADADGLMHRFGVWGTGMALYARNYFGFLGQVGEAIGQWLLRPASFRVRELFVQLEAVGVGALPIIALMTFLIGIVFTYLLGIQIEKFGANIFIVDGVGLAIARELAPLLTALLVAGRSGAAFTAQIGAMKVTEEIDAIRTLGLSPIQVLVLPRLLAIMIALPLLTFMANVSGLVGAALVAQIQLDITWYTFFTRLQDVLPLYTVWLGLAKAPVFASAIAIIACQNGFSVARDARSVGEHTTRTVVWSLVSVILIDALFAIAFPKIEP